jgi:hypothetical protein
VSIIQFPNGAAIHSSVIASIHVESGRKVGELEHPAHIIVYTFKEGFGGLLSLYGNKPSAAHFMSIPMPTENEAREECRRLVAKWMGLPEPTATATIA